MNSRPVRGYNLGRDSSRRGPPFAEHMFSDRGFLSALHRLELVMQQVSEVVPIALNTLKAFEFFALRWRKMEMMPPVDADCGRNAL